MEPGVRVEVRSRFEGHWSRGFEVHEVVVDHDATRYRLRRRSDGSVLPALFDPDDVREERRRAYMWWA